MAEECSVGKCRMLFSVENHPELLKVLLLINMLSMGSSEPFGVPLLGHSSVVQSNELST